MTNLTQKAIDGKLDPVVGRAKEIERVIQILGRRTKNNPVLIGEPGVGKTIQIISLMLYLVCLLQCGQPCLLRAGNVPKQDYATYGTAVIALFQTKMSEKKTLSFSTG